MHKELKMEGVVALRLKNLLFRDRYMAKKKSVFYFLLMSYTFILLIPVFFCGIVYIIASNEIMDEINRSSIAMLKQMQVAIDSTLDEAQRLSINITNNTKVFKVAGFKAPLQNSDKYAVSELLTELRGYNMTSKCIKNFYIYLKELDMIISPVTVGESKVMHEVLGHQSFIPYEQWHDMLQQQHAMHSIPLAWEDEAGRSDMMVAVMQSIPINAPLKPLGTVVVLIDENELMEMAKSIHGANTGDVLIINKNNEVLAATKNYTKGSLPRYEDLKGDSGVLYLELEGKKVSLFYNTSEVSKLKYIELVPQNIVHQRNIKTRIIMFASILLCLIIGGVAAVILAVKNYNPVKELLKLLSDSNNTINMNQQQNEYHIIQEVIRSTMQEKERLRKKIGDQNLAFRTSYIEKLLKGRIEHKENSLDILASMDICLYSEYFAVMLFHIDDFGDIFSVVEGENAKQRLETVQFVFKNVVEEICGQNHLGIMIDVDDRMVCLINFKPEGIHNAKQDLQRIAEETQEFIGNRFHVSFTISISKAHHMLSGIQEAWEEANEAMEYGLVGGTCKLIQYEDIKISSNDYFYPLDMEYKLVNCIKAGDSSAAVSIIDRIFEANLTKGILSLQMAKCLMYDLICTVIKITEELSSTQKIILPEETELVGKLMNCRTLPGIKILMTKIILQLCEKIQNGKRNMNYRMSDSIAEYIKENFQNANLGLSMIAEYFEITPTYVSRIFKEQIGEGILDYINRIRLEKAKQLMKEGELNISTVAEKVGYTQSRALIRLFKKYEGVTPGKFKDLWNSQQVQDLDIQYNDLT